MFQFLGRITSRRAPVVLAIWLIVLSGSLALAPPWNEVAENGEFAFLPPDAPSRVAEGKFREAFRDRLASNVVLVLRRETSRSPGLLEQDFAFISEILVPGIRKIADLPPQSDTRLNDTGEHLVSRIFWYGTKASGGMFNSEDGRASLIVMELSTEFLDQGNEPLIAAVEDLLRDVDNRWAGDPAAIPAGLDVTFSGSATFGRDMIRASKDSARSTERWTVILVVVLLVAIYRAPLLALIPLTTVVIATLTSLALLALAAKAGWITLFNGIETYVTVLLYGAGVDYCLFLIARYREELDSGATIEEALSRTLERVGAAVTASAGTVMCGIGMMVFAEFGKFRQAGIAITFGLFVCLLSALTLTPALLRILGRWAFWPNIVRRDRTGTSGWLARSDAYTRLSQINLLQKGWSRVGQLLQTQTFVLWIGSIVALIPLAIAGIVWFSDLSYGLLSELPETSACVRGAHALTAHFPAGESGVLNVLVRARGIDFSTHRSLEGNQIVRELTDNLLQRKREFGLHSVRSMSDPTGQRESVRDGVSRMVARNLGRKSYTSETDPEVTRLELVFDSDPFARNSISEFRALRSSFPEFLPEQISDAEFSFLGVTPNLSDLKSVTDRDQIRIDILVMLSVFLVLVVLLRRPGICAYLMFTVFLSYLATLGLTFIVFRALDPEGFSGLDWKVPLFLFTILIAVGEDYNIFLMTRIDEESKRYGAVNGIRVAVERTGSIISSCGIIMAGTFASLLAGSLVGMYQLGFALAFGVLLDTFLVRPIMVPSFLILLAEGRLGVFSRLAGYTTSNSPDIADRSDSAS